MKVLDNSLIFENIVQNGPNTPKSVQNRGRPNTVTSRHSSKISRESIKFLKALRNTPSVVDFEATHCCYAIICTVLQKMYVKFSFLIEACYEFIFMKKERYARNFSII